MVTLGGIVNFFGIYNAIITARILLSWCVFPAPPSRGEPRGSLVRDLRRFPQAQGQPLLQPIFVVTDPFLNLFRGLIPPIAGLDLSILPALFLLQALGNAVPALSADFSSLL